MSTHFKSFAIHVTGLDTWVSADSFGILISSCHRCLSSRSVPNRKVTCAKPVSQTAVHRANIPRQCRESVRPVFTLAIKVSKCDLRNSPQVICEERPCFGVHCVNFQWGLSLQQRADWAPEFSILRECLPHFGGHSVHEESTCVFACFAPHHLAAGSSTRHKSKL